MPYFGYSVEVSKLKDNVKQTRHNDKKDYDSIYSFVRNKFFDTRKDMIIDAQKILDKLSAVANEEGEYADFERFGKLGGLLSVYVQDDGSAGFTHFECRRDNYLIVMVPYNYLNVRG